MLSKKYIFDPNLSKERIIFMKPNLVEEMLEGNEKEDITAEWYVDTEYDCDAEIDGNSITLTCSDIDAISNTITLKIINSGMESQLEVSVRA